MKKETIELLEQFLKDRKFQFIDSSRGLELEYSITDEEKTKLVNLEYGNHLSSSVDELFVAIMKKLVKLAVEKAKEDFKDKLTEL